MALLRVRPCVEETQGTGAEGGRVVFGFQ